MRIVRWLKKGIISGLGMLFVFPNTVNAMGKAREPGRVEPSNEEQVVTPPVSAKDLVTALQNMHRNPEEITVVSAMCYEMMMPPEEVEFACPTCGKKTTYAYNSDAGRLAQELPYIVRSLESLPYSITVDAAGLCSACGKDKPQVLVMRAACRQCGKNFSWPVVNEPEAVQLHWLYQKLPFREIDGHYLDIWGTQDREKIQQGAVYIRDHVFCPECRKNINLKEEEQ
jgi:predicted RNA-binding Zn-ribbon protein involved in translation (DUF1610 family)